MKTIMEIHFILPPLHKAAGKLLNTFCFCDGLKSKSFVCFCDKTIFIRKISLPNRFEMVMNSKMLCVNACLKKTVCESCTANYLKEISCV